MRKKQFHSKDVLGLLLALTLSFWYGTPAHSQSSPAQSNKPTPVTDARLMELQQFDQFLDSHREIDEQIRKDPSLVNNKDFMQKHPALQTFMQNNPGVREEITEDPSGAMKAMNQLERRNTGRDSDTTTKELAQFDRFMDSHREISEQLRKNPSLVNNKEFVQKHPALQTYLQEHQGVREEIRENPNAFMRQEGRFDRHEDARDNDNGKRDNYAARRDNDNARRDNDDVARRDSDNARKDNDAARRDNDNARRDNDDFARRDNDNARKDNDATRRDNDNMRRNNDTTHQQLARFDQFADSHREIAEQLRKDPSLVNNKDFVQKHPALQAYMQEHPGISEEMKENPNAFMRQENRFDHHEDARDNDIARGHMASFGEFLGGHSDVARQVSKDPSLVKNDDFMKSHPDLQAFVNAHPGMREEMKQNPQSFVKSAQQFNTTNSGAAAKTTPAPTGDTTKPKQ